MEHAPAADGVKVSVAPERVLDERPVPVAKDPLPAGKSERKMRIRREADVRVMEFVSAEMPLSGEIPSERRYSEEISGIVILLVAQN